MLQIPGKIILVDNGPFEKDLLDLALSDIDYEAQIKHFSSAEKALEYLKKTKDKIFIIISEVNLVQMSGMDFIRAIDSDEDLALKSIPFIFMTMVPEMNNICEAYKYRVQGYFKKPMTVQDQAKVLCFIVNYWMHSLHPNKSCDFDVL